METKIDTKGRVVIPEQVGEKKKGIKDFFGLKVKRTGKPEWITPKEIKSIRE